MHCDNSRTSDYRRQTQHRTFHSINYQCTSKIFQTGILISASASVIIDPFASLLIGFFGPLAYFAYAKLAEGKDLESYYFDYLISAILGGVFSAIFTGGRNNRTPPLSLTPV